jgi:hypothetical protein
MLYRDERQSIALIFNIEFAKEHSSCVIVVMILR